MRKNPGTLGQGQDFEKIVPKIDRSRKPRVSGTIFFFTFEEMVQNNTWITHMYVISAGFGGYGSGIYTSVKPGFFGIPGLW